MGSGNVSNTNRGELHPVSTAGRKKVYETDYIIITYSDQVRAIVAAWKTPPLSDEFREGMEMMLRAMNHFKTGKIVADTVYMGAVHPNDQEWVASRWYSRAAEAGFSHNAIVVPSDIFTEMSVEAILNRVENNVAVIKYFPAVDEAIAWIGNF